MNHAPAGSGGIRARLATSTAGSRVRLLLIILFASSSLLLPLQQAAAKTSTTPCPAFSKAQKDLAAAQKDFKTCTAAAKGKTSSCKAQAKRVLELTALIEKGPDKVCNPGPSFKTGLGEEIDKAIDKSPAFRQTVKDLLAKGYTITYGEKGKGSYINKSEKRIVIDGNEKGNTAAVLQTIAHEAGHAGYKNTYTPPNGLTRDQYIAKNVRDCLDDEGEATLRNLELRADLSKNGGTKIAVAGSQAKKYEEIYKQYLKDGDRAKARRAIGEVFATKERPSTDPSKNYRDYYADWYGKQYDKWKKSQGKG